MSTATYPVGQWFDSREQAEAEVVLDRVSSEKGRAEHEYAIGRPTNRLALEAARVRESRGIATDGDAQVGHAGE